MGDMNKSVDVIDLKISDLVKLNINLDICI